MNLVLPDSSGVRIGFLDNGRSMNDEEFFAWCQQNRDLRMERFGDNEVVVMSPSGLEADFRGAEVARQIANWSSARGDGFAFGSNAGFTLPDGSVLSPDAGWVSKERLRGTPLSDRRRFANVVPELVVEIPSPSDSMAHVRRKMALWVEHGVRVALLVDADGRSTEIWRASGVEMSREATICLEEFSGLCLALEAVWRGMSDLA